jgi:hypothetical protein
MTANTFVAFSNNLTNSMFIKIAIFIMGVIFEKYRGYQHYRCSKKNYFLTMHNIS